MTFADIYEGFVFLKPVKELSPCSWMKGFISDEMFEKSKAYYEFAYGRKFKDAKEVDEFLSSGRRRLEAHGRGLDLAALVSTGRALTRKEKSDDSQTFPDRRRASQRQPAGLGGPGFGRRRALGRAAPRPRTGRPAGRTTIWPKSSPRRTSRRWSST